MGWIFSLILFIFACYSGNYSIFVASGLFAIAGSVGVYNSTKKSDK